LNKFYEQNYLFTVGEYGRSYTDTTRFLNDEPSRSERSTSKTAREGKSKNYILYVKQKNMGRYHIANSFNQNYHT